MKILLSLFSYLFLQGVGLLILILCAGLFGFWVVRRLYSKKAAVLFALLTAAWFLIAVLPVGFPNLLQYPTTLKTYGPAAGPVLTLSNVFRFFAHADEMEQVEDIAYDPNDIPAPINRDHPEKIKIEITAKEVISEMAPGVFFNYWTFDGRVPGPFLRVREGDTVELTLKNDPTSLHSHSIDLHAVTGPGGGAVVTDVAPGEEKTFTFKALNPGLYVYHCAHPNVAAHMAHGMYGLILVEPEGGLEKADKEFYVMQGEFYSKGKLGSKGVQVFDAMEMLRGDPRYVVFNGRVGGAVGKMQANVGERVRIYVGNGGVNLISSFHVIGEIFDRVFPEAAIGGEPHKNVQTTIVPAGGATIVEFDLQVPGKNILVDHALARLDLGAWATLEVFGEENPEVFSGVMDDPGQSGH